MLTLLKTVTFAGPASYEAPYWSDFAFAGDPIPYQEEKKKGRKHKKNPISYSISPEYQLPQMNNWGPPIPAPFPVKVPYEIEKPLENIHHYDTSESYDFEKVLIKDVHEEYLTEKQPMRVRQEYQVTANASSHCPPNYVSVDKNTCESYATAPVKLECPEGYQKDGLDCQGWKKEVPSYTCPEDWHESEGACWKEVQSTYTSICPAGSTREGLECIAHVSTDPVQYCKVGQPTKGGCEEIITHPIEWECHDHFTLVNDQCVKTATQDVSLSCPQGYDIADGRCTHYQEIEPTLVCADGYSINGSVCEYQEVADVQYDCVFGELNHNFECQEKVSVPAIPYCSYPSKADPQGCVQEVYKKGSKKKSEILISPTLYKCDAGWELIDQHCWKTNYLGPATASCPYGFLESSKSCIKRKTTPLSKKCPIGFIMQGKTCSKRDFRPLQYNCPVDWEMGIDGCSKVEVLVPSPICPHGMLPALHEHKCTSRIVNTASLYCADGFSLMDDGLCVKEVRHAADLRCPEGYSETENGCVAMESSQLITTCPELYKLEGHACLLELRESRIKMCPIGYDYVPDKRDDSAMGSCSMRKLSPMIFECPDGYEYDSLTERCYIYEVSYDLVTQTTSSTPEEALLDLGVDETTTTTTTAMVQQDLFAPVAPPPAPMVTIIQQPVPITQPQIILPRPNPPPMKKERPIVPMPYPEPYPMYTSARPPMISSPPIYVQEHKDKKHHH